MSRRAPIRLGSIRLGRALGLVTVAFVLAGCGLGTQDSAERIDPIDVPNGLLSKTVPGAVLGEGPATFSVYLTGVEGNSVVPLARKSPQPPQAQDVVDTLLQGPSADELAIGLRSAIPFGTSARVRQSGSAATIDLSSSFVVGAPLRQQTLALSQLLCTVTSVQGVERARFTVVGGPISVPRRDGAATTEPLSASESQFPCQA
jgi:hypothetical protein